MYFAHHTKSFLASQAIPDEYNPAKEALQNIVTPELKTLQIEIKRLDEKMDGKITSLRAEMLTVFQIVDGKNCFPK